MQIEKDGIVYEVIPAIVEMTQKEKDIIIEQNKKILSELWDIIIPEKCPFIMREMLEELQETIRQKRDDIEGEIIDLEWQ